MKNKFRNIYLIVTTFLILGYLVIQLFEYKYSSSKYSFKEVLSNKLKSTLNIKPLRTLQKLENHINLSLDDDAIDNMDSCIKYLWARDFASYNKTRKWHKTKLEYKGNVYDVAVKMHGKEPEGHIHKNFYSITVKFLGKDRPLKFKRVNLIIYDRIKDSMNNIIALGETFDLYHSKGKWCSMAINGKESYLYLIEYRLNKDKFYAKEFKTNLTNLSQYSPELNVIYSFEHDYDETINYINKLKNKNKINAEIHQVLTQINNYLLAGNDSIFEYFDFNYLSRFLACHLVANFKNHGFVDLNIKYLWNEETKKIYPMITRDNFVHSIDFSSDIIKGLWTYEEIYWSEYKNNDFPFFKKIYQNDSLIISALKLLDKENLFIKFSKNKSKWESKYHDIFENYFFYECFNKEKDEIVHGKYSNKPYSLKVVKSNWKIINNQNKDIKDYIKLSRSNFKDNIFKISIINESLIPLKIKDLRLLVKPEQNIKGDFHVINLTDTLSSTRDIKFHDALQFSKKVPLIKFKGKRNSNYHLVWELNDNSSLLDTLKVKMNLFNSITDCSAKELTWKAETTRFN